jgi:hypothetical protein
MKKNRIVILIFLIIILGILAILNVRKSNQITVLKSEIKNLESHGFSKIFSSFKISQDIFNELEVNKKINLVAIFGNYGCMRCKLKLAQNINELSKTYSDNISVIFTGDSNNDFQKLGLNLNYRRNALIESTFPPNINGGQPIAFIVDDQRNLLLFLNAEPDHIEKIDEYFQIIHQVFNTMQKNTRQ